MATMTASATAATRTGRRPLSAGVTTATDDCTAYLLIGDEGDEGGETNLNALALYLEEVRRHPLLAADEERALLAAVRSDDPDAARAARERLCACNLRLVVSVAVRYRAVPGITVLDLIQEGTIGLLHAISTFDPMRASRLSTHATWWIWQAISRAIGSQARVVRLPIYVRTVLSTIRHARRALTQTLLREPTVEEIAAALAGTTHALDADEIHALESAVAPVVSLDAPILSDDPTSTALGDLLGDDGGLSDAGALGADPAETTVDALTHAATVAWLLDPVMDEWAGAMVGRTNAETGEREMHLFEPLTARERLVLRLRYGLDGGRRLDLRETGQEIGVSRERVRQIQETALDKLRMLAELIGLDAREVL